MSVPRRATIRPHCLLVHEVDRGHAEAGGEHAVEGGGGAPALDVAERGVAGLDAGAVLDLVRDALADAAQARAAVGLVPLAERARPPGPRG